MPKVVVAQGLCCPSRALVEQTARNRLMRYSFNNPSISARETKTCWEITCDFSEKAVEWGLYVLMRYNYQFVRADLPEHTIEQNIKNAQRYTGAAIYEEGCDKKPKAKSQPGLLSSIRGGGNPPPPWSETRKPWPATPKKKPRRRKQKSAGLLDALKELLR